MKRHLPVVVLLACGCSLVLARWAMGQQHGIKSEGPLIFTPKEIEWKDGPASLPPGTKMAVLEGDPTKEGPFTMRLRAPDGYQIPPHTHPKTERLTVISGDVPCGDGREVRPGLSDRHACGHLRLLARGHDAFRPSPWRDGRPTARHRALANRVCQSIG